MAYFLNGQEWLGLIALYNADLSVMAHSYALSKHHITRIEQKIEKLAIMTISVHENAAKKTVKLR